MTNPSPQPPSIFRRVHVTPRTVVVVVITALLLLGALSLLRELSQLVRWCVISVFLATALDPVVAWLNRRRVPRALSILVVYLILLLLFIGLIALLLPPLVEQVQELGGFLVEQFQDPAGLTKRVEDLADRYGLGQYVEQAYAQASTLPSRLTGAGLRVLSITRSIVGGITSLFSILLITFFLLLDGRKFVEGALTFVAPSQQPRVRRVLERSAGAVSGYITGNLIISVIAGVTTFVVLWILGMPYAVPLALVVAFFDLIPLVGATLGAIIVTLVGFFVDPTKGFVLLGFFVVYQQIENNLLQPLIYGRSVRLHPLAVFIAAVAGAQLLGILGALLAIPVAEIIRILISEALSGRVHSDVGSTAASSPTTAIDAGSVDAATSGP